MNQSAQERALLILGLILPILEIVMRDVFFFVLGLAFGSFANVLIDRLPTGQGILGRSHCDYCGRTLAWYELVPLVSWTFQMGRCRTCKRVLSVQYPIVELSTAVGFVLLSLFFGPPSLFLTAALIIFFACLVIFVADLKYQIIPDSMLAVVIVGTSLLWATPIRQGASIIPYVVSGGSSFIFFYLLWLMSRGKAMGFGDVKLSFVLGFLLGYPATVVALYVAFLTGAIVGVILILVRFAGFKSKIAFGPFLIFGILAALTVGNDIVNLWNKFL